MLLSGNAGAVAYRERHPEWNTVVDEDIEWALRNYYVNYETETDMFTTSAIGEFKLMETKGNC